MTGPQDQSTFGSSLLSVTLHIPKFTLYLDKVPKGLYESGTIVPGPYAVKSLPTRPSFKLEHGPKPPRRKERSVERSSQERVGSEGTESGPESFRRRYLSRIRLRNPRGVYRLPTRRERRDVTGKDLSTTTHHYAIDGDPSLDYGLSRVILRPPPSKLRPDTPEKGGTGCVDQWRRCVPRSGPTPRLGL